MREKWVYMMRDKIGRRGYSERQFEIYFSKFSETSQVVGASVTNLISVQCKILKSVLE